MTGGNSGLDGRSAIWNDGDRATSAGDSATARPRRTGLVVWAAILLAAAGLIAFLRVPIFLGTQVTCAVGPYFGRGETACRKTSDTQIWRVWWNSRSSLVHVNPQWLLTAALGASIAALVAATAAALWLVLNGHDRNGEFSSDQDPPSVISAP